MLSRLRGAAATSDRGRSWEPELKARSVPAPRCTCARICRSLGLSLAAVAASVLFYWVVFNGLNAAVLRRGAVEAASLGWVPRGRAIPILMTAYGRPQYLRVVLAALENVSKIDDTIVVVSQDGFNKEVETLIQRAAQGKRMHVVHLRHYRPFLNIPSYFHSSAYAACWNVRFLLDFAFEYLQAPAAIVLDDDLVPGVDMYEYYRWAYERLSADPVVRPRLFSINGYRLGSRATDDPYAFIWEGFTVWGAMFLGYRWPMVKQYWPFYHDYDIAMQAGRERENLLSATPMLSRIRNIGLNGINFRVEEGSHAAQELARVYVSPVPLPYAGHQPTYPPLPDRV